MQMEDFKPIPLAERSLSTKSTFMIWGACNLVITSVLTGMYMIPSLSLETALMAIFFGSAIGAIPLTLVALMGTKTGLATMAASRATFGVKGSMIPSGINVVTLAVWSWIQAGIGGYALNYASIMLFNFDNHTIYTIITQVLVVVIALYAIKGIALYEKVTMVVLVLIFGAVIFTAVTSFGVGGIFGFVAGTYPLYEALSTMEVFDLVVVTALTWTPLAADYNRYCKTQRASVLGTGLGYTLGSTLSKGIGALVIVMILLTGTEVPLDADGGIHTSEVFSMVGFGIAGAIAIFMSVIAANVMCVYSSTISFLNIFPRASFRKSAIGIGVICVVGAVFSGILGVFLDWIFLLGALFMPLFAIIIADFYVIQKQNYQIDAILSPETHKEYSYSNGWNLKAIVVYLFSAGLSYYWIINPIPIGFTIPAFVIAFVLYILACKYVKTK
ncbi:MAG: cytosine permease [Oscillospiraceae bacterium]|nr:cytosine permease [Oscillospiraceae bacterium]